jgi:chromatin remodeling complex protein RSC6
MATAKKSAAGAKKAAAKKSSAKKAAPAKKAAAKKAPAKKAAAKGGAAKKATATKGAAKAPAATKGAAKGGATKKRAVNPALMAPMQPSADLAVVVGNKPMPRSEVAKQLWAYIKKNNLQDQQNRRNINADDNLRKVFGGKKTVSMFDMTKLVSGHLTPAS